MSKGKIDWGKVHLAAQKLQAACGVPPRLVCPRRRWYSLKPRCPNCRRLLPAHNVMRGRYCELCQDND